MYVWIAAENMLVEDVILYAMIAEAILKAMIMSINGLKYNR